MLISLKILFGKSYFRQKMCEWWLKVCLKVIWSHLRLLKKILQIASQDFKFCKSSRPDIVQASTPWFFLYCSSINEVSKTQKILGKICHVSNMGPSPYRYLITVSRKLEFNMSFYSETNWGGSSEIELYLLRCTVVVKPVVKSVIDL